MVNLVWSIAEAERVLENYGLERNSNNDLCDVLDSLFRELGMPRSPKEVGTDPRENKVVLREVARKTLNDRWAKTIPRPLETEEQVTEILRMAT
jgi:alcohol dehydrogenase class IV